MAELLKTDGTSTTIEPKNGKNFTLAELYELIDCQMIEVIYLKHGTRPDDLIMIGDEDGRWDEAEENPLATMLYRSKWGPNVSNIVGNIVLCPSSMLK
jgi:hypothetical protein